MSKKNAIAEKYIMIDSHTIIICAWGGDIYKVMKSMSDVSVYSVKKENKVYVIMYMI